MMNGDLTTAESFIHLFVLFSAFFVIGVLPFILKWQENKKERRKLKKHKKEIK